MLCWCFGVSVRTGPINTLSSVDSRHDSAGNVLPLPKMAKRKRENRSFLDRWETEYLFTYVKDRPVCLVCGANVAITKEYNIRRHCETKHHDKYKDLDMTQRRQKIEEMKRSLVSQQTTFKKAISQSEAAVKASLQLAAGSRDRKISPALQ